MLLYENNKTLFAPGYITTSMCYSFLNTSSDSGYYNFYSTLLIQKNNTDMSI